MIQTWLYIGIFSGLLSVGVAIYLYFWVMRQDPGSEKAQQVAGWIREGAASYLKRLYTALTLMAVILALSSLSFSASISMKWVPLT
jgi:K(+)-stimulated pyrophosphate-energized sodium pump